MRLTKSSTFLLGFFFSMFLFWVGIQASNIKDLPINLFYSFVIAILSFLGGTLGLLTSRHLGSSKSAVGKSLLFISIGTISWSLGNFVWSFYNFLLSTEVPYPSWADVGFLGAVPLWMIGSFYLAKATGVKYGLRKRAEQLYLIILPVVAFVVSYYLLITIARDGAITSGEGLLKVFFDFAYPLSDVFIIIIALLVYGLSFRYLGGRYKWPVFITLFGFVVMFLADFSFSYTTTIETYFNGYYPDLLFTSALFLISFGVTSFDHRVLSPLAAFPTSHAGAQTPDTLLISHIIKAHEGLIGPIALEYAREIQGLQVYNLEHIEITGDIKEVLEKLVSEYSSLFGKVAIEVSKEEVKKISSFPTDHLPGVLK